MDVGMDVDVDVLMGVVEGVACGVGAVVTRGEQDLELVCGSVRVTARVWSGGFLSLVRTRGGVREAVMMIVLCHSVWTGHYVRSDSYPSTVSGYSTRPITADEVADATSALVGVLLTTTPERSSRAFPQWAVSLSESDSTNEVRFTGWYKPENNAYPRPGYPRSDQVPAVQGTVTNPAMLRALQDVFA